MDSEALRDGQHLVRSLGTNGESVAVWGADGTWAAPGWSLLTVDVGMKAGTPFGSLTYEELTSSQTSEVAVRWDYVHDQLQCFVLDRAVVRNEREALERDARARTGALLRISAEIGWRFASNKISRTDMYEAAGLEPDPVLRNGDVAKESGYGDLPPRHR